VNRLSENSLYNVFLCDFPIAKERTGLHASLAFGSVQPQIRSGRGGETDQTIEKRATSNREKRLASRLRGRTATDVISPDRSARHDSKGWNECWGPVTCRATPAKRSTQSMMRRASRSTRKGRAKFINGRHRNQSNGNSATSTTSSCSDGAILLPAQRGVAIVAAVDAASRRLRQ
jgi:hypothetical protein